MLTFPTSYFLIEGRFDFKAEHVLMDVLWVNEWEKKGKLSLPAYKFKLEWTSLLLILPMIIL